MRQVTSPEEEGPEEELILRLGLKTPRGGTSVTAGGIDMKPPGSDRPS